MKPFVMGCDRGHQPVTLRYPEPSGRQRTPCSEPRGGRGNEMPPGRSAMPGNRRGLYRNRAAERRIQDTRQRYGVGQRPFRFVGVEELSGLPADIQCVLKQRVAIFDQIEWRGLRPQISHPRAERLKNGHFSLKRVKNRNELQASRQRGQSGNSRISSRSTVNTGGNLFRDTTAPVPAYTRNAGDMICRYRSWRDSRLRA